MAKKQTQNFGNPTLIEWPRSCLQNQKSLQTEPHKQVEKQKRVQDDILVHPSHQPSPEQIREPTDQTELQKKLLRSSNLYSQQAAGKNVVDSWQNFIRYWAAEKTWPREYFEDDKMNHLLADKKSPVSQKRTNPGLTSSITGASDERPREEKSAPYKNPNYPNSLLEDVKNYMSYSCDHEIGTSDASKKLLDKLLYTEANPPKDALFCDEIFDKHRQKLKEKNESRIIQDLSPLLVPSAEAFASFGAKDLKEALQDI